MRIKLTIEYDGTDLCGWQYQENGESVQGDIQKAIRELTGETVEVYGSGRTDAGVHALGQVAHFDTDCTIPPEKIAFALNVYLPDYIRIKKSELVSNDFHARFNAKRKTYLYKFYTGDIPSAINRRTSVFVKGKLNYEKMLQAATFMVGTNDYACFMATGSIVKDTVRTVYSINVDKCNNEYTVEVTGNGFLYNMVRIMVGTLIYVGLGKINAQDISSIIYSKDRTKAGVTMPPEGLYLKSVEYIND